MLIIAFVHTQPEGHREPRNEVGSLSPAEHLVGFEPGTFQFLLQRLNPLKAKFNFNIYDVTDWIVNNYNTYITQ